MAVGFDATTFKDFSASTGGTWTHVPVGTPNGMAVLIAGNASTADQISSVAYGGGTLTRIASIAGGLASEPGRAYMYFRGTVVASSAATVNVVASVAHTFTCWSVSLTGGGSELVVAGTATLGTTSVANPSGTVSLSPSANGVALGVLFSGSNAPASNVYNSGYTALGGSGGQGVDFGSQSANAERGTVASAVSSFALGWTASADDAALIASLVKATTLYGVGVRATGTGAARAGSVTVTNPWFMPYVNRALEAV